MDVDLNLNNIVQYVMQDLGNEICDIEYRRRNAKPRNENYFEIIIPRYTDVQFIEHFVTVRLSVIGNVILPDVLVGISGFRQSRDSTRNFNK